MAASLEETLISVWQQALAVNARSVKLENRTFPVRRTSRSRLVEVDFQFEGHKLRGLEQNPETASRWAQLAREGKKVMQFLQERRYIAVVVDGKLRLYRKPTPSHNNLGRSAESDNRIWTVTDSKPSELGNRSALFLFHS